MNRLKSKHQYRSVDAKAALAAADWGKQARRLLTASALLVGAAIVTATAARADTMDMKFTLDWKFQGPTSFFLLAEEKGYYKDVGLNVAIDSGKGSAGAGTRVASGAYEMGFADINALIDYNSKNPDKAIKAVMMVYDFPPFSVFTLKKNGISSPADLKGKTLGAPGFDASYKLFPAFAKATNLEEASVEKKNMDPALREVMLVRGEVDFISGHYFSSFLDLKSKGVAESDIVAMRYSDFGLDFYGNAVIASPDMLANHGDKIKAFLGATAKALKEVLADPKVGIAATKSRDPLIDEALELERLELAIKTNIVTPNTQRDGIGGIDKGRMARAVDQVALSYGLTNKPTPDDLFTDAFLPPNADRMP